MQLRHWHSVTQDILAQRRPGGETTSLVVPVIKASKHESLLADDTANLSLSTPSRAPSSPAFNFETTNKE